MGTGIIAPTDRQLKQVWDMLDGMAVGKTFKVAEAKKPDVFIACCKMHIDCFKLHQFNKNYTVIKRISNPTVEVPVIEKQWRIKKPTEV